MSLIFMSILLPRRLSDVDFSDDWVYHLVGFFITYYVEIADLTEFVVLYLMVKLSRNYSNRMYYMLNTIYKYPIFFDVFDLHADAFF